MIHYVVVLFSLGLLYMLRTTEQLFSTLFLIQWLLFDRFILRAASTGHPGRWQDVPFLAQLLKLRL